MVPSALFSSRKEKYPGRLLTEGASLTQFNYAACTELQYSQSTDPKRRCTRHISKSNLSEWQAEDGLRNLYRKQKWRPKMQIIKFHRIWLYSGAAEVTVFFLTEQRKSQHIDSRI